MLSQLSRDFRAGAGLLRDKDAVLGTAIKETLCTNLPLEITV